MKFRFSLLAILVTAFIVGANGFCKGPSSGSASSHSNDNDRFECKEDEMKWKHIDGSVYVHECPGQACVNGKIGPTSDYYLVGQEFFMKYVCNLRREWSLTCAAFRYRTDGCAHKQKSCMGQGCDGQPISIPYSYPYIADEGFSDWEFTTECTEEDKKAVSGNTSVKATSNKLSLAIEGATKGINGLVYSNIMSSNLSDEDKQLAISAVKKTSPPIKLTKQPSCSPTTEPSPIGSLSGAGSAD